MRIGLQLLLGYILVAMIACYLVFTFFLQEVKPTVRRATEGMLIDTSVLLATVVAGELSSIKDVKKSVLIEAFININQTPIQAKIDGMIKNKMTYRVYITDEKGIVVFDSDKLDEGKDYSRWNDVYLTLRGKYGARTTYANPNDPTSSVMYVAAPIKINGQLVGVLTVAKPNQSMAVIVNKGETRILFGGTILIIVALLIGIFMIWWINRSIRKLVNYANQVSHREAAILPKLRSKELKILGNALEDMRLKLEGKDYIEKYVHTLAHELKSPLSSIRAATEILHDSSQKLQEEPSELNTIQTTQIRFLMNIDQQTERMSILIDRMLQLARLESRVGVNVQTVNMAELIDQAVDNKMADAQLLGITLTTTNKITIKVKGDKFLLIQALENLLTNALDFTPIGGHIHINTTMDDDFYSIAVIDTGTGIPDYALDRIYERFYSLPRPNKGKSSGLGLAFVKEVALLHNGYVVIENRTDNIKGAIATLTIKVH